MSANLVEIDRPQYSLFEIPGCEFTETSLSIKPGMKFEHWQRLVRLLERTEQAIQWYLGDALNYGEGEYGDKYAQVLDAHKKTGIPIDTLRNYQWVADNVKPVTRVTTLDWSIHREVASLPEAKQKEVLQSLAEKKEVKGKVTRREAEREATRVKREGKEQPKDTAPVLSKEARAYLDEYMAELAMWPEKIPPGIPTSDRDAIEKMVYGQGGDALWLKNRTREADHKAIAELFSFDEGTPGMERATRAEISAYLEKCGYFMSDSDLNERLFVMVESKMLAVKSVEDSRQEGRRGTMIDLYALHPEYQARLESFV